MTDVKDQGHIENELVNAIEIKKMSVHLYFD